MDCLPHIHVAAIHAPSEVEYKTFTPGIGVLCRKSDFFGGVGVYSNSHGNRSFYASSGWQPIKVGPVAIGAFAGVVDGYRRGGGKFVPMAGLMASWGHIHVIAWPRADKESAAGAAISFTF
ncbi:hypothetical protein [Hydrogenophaga sp.]|uniref:hypothetical protein n=1 Tax=Hydrogenophaga sp. TaxID=1904254 RepID=UPI0025C714BF|nr:hypothetical protein [Hydrogenophaga sp.]